MKKNFTLIVLLSCFTLIETRFNQVEAQTTQSFINKLWEDRTGTPDTIDYASTAWTSNSIIIAGNTLGTGLFTDMLLTKYDKHGNAIWQTTYDNNSLSDYGTAVKIGADDTIYVGGTSMTSTGNNFDYVIQKYDPDGNLIWTTTYNGTGSSYDVVSDVFPDDSGNVYVTGASYGDTTDLDYVTLKLDNAGNILWTKRFGGIYPDIAATLNVSYGRVLVAGVLSSTPSHQFFGLLQYNAAGTQVAGYKDSLSNHGYDVITSVAKDDVGNFYITGRAFNGTDYDILTIKLNPFLDSLWAVVYDGGYNDEGSDIKVDAFGNIYVCGKVELSNNTTKGILIAYDPNGSEIWEQGISAPKKEYSSEARKVSISGVSQITVASRTESASGYYINLFTKDLSGNTLWSKDYLANPTYDNIPISLKQESNGDIYLTSISHGDTSDYIITKFNALNFPYNPIYASDTSIKIPYIANQIIIKFSPDIVNKDFVDTRDLEYAKPEDVLPDSVISMMEDKLGISFSGHEEVKLLKIFKWMTYSDSLSITRMGDTIVMDKLWSIFLMTLPNTLDEVEANDSLKTLVADYYTDSTYLIRYCELNSVFSSMNIPNDDDFGDQISLEDNVTFPDAGINMDDAWDIETGKPNVRVGIIDNGAVDWAHEDFGDGTFAGCKFVDGKDYGSSTALSNVTTYAQHATACAGIIGALRFNDLGVSGIAGGDVDGNGGDISLSGVSLVSLAGGSVANTISAISEGAANTTGGNGFSLNIESNSYGLTESKINEFSAAASADYFPSLKDAVKSVYDNYCIFVASRGNYYTNPDGSENTTANDANGVSGMGDAMYPACFDGRWVLNVAASGSDGLHKEGGPGGNGDDIVASLVRNYIDIDAPGALEIVVSTNEPNFTPYDDQTANFNILPYADVNYTNFSGTSSACPHVAGVAALMLSHHNVNEGYPTNLDNTDVEYLIKTNPTVIAGQNGFMDGAGLLNAAGIMPLIDVNHHYWIQHNGGYSESLTVTTPTILLTAPLGTLSAGIYPCSLTAVIRTYSMGTAFGSTSPTLFDHWFRREVFGSGPTLADLVATPIWHDFQYSNSGGSITVTITTYCWKVYNNIGQLVLSTPLPSEIKTDFSLHFFDSGITSTDEIKNTKSEFLYPNPSVDYANLNFALDKVTNAKIEIVDILGQVIQTIDGQNLNIGNHIINLNTSEFSSGLYFVNFKSEKYSFTKKLVINH